MGDELWSGWGIRTMSTGDAAYNPLSYHNGTVWPHDTSLGAWGLVRAGRQEDMHRIARSLFEAARFFDWSLPEVFAGFDASETPVPDRLSDGRAAAGVGGRNAGAAAAAAARPRARPASRQLRATAESAPEWVDGLELDGVRALGQLVATSRVDERSGRQSRKLPDVKIAVLSPVWFPVPPSGYGGIEWIVSLLADGLADAGHDVTLFASGDSHTRAKLAAVFERRRASGSGRRSGSSSTRSTASRGTTTST